MRRKHPHRTPLQLALVLSAIICFDHLALGFSPLSDTIRSSDGLSRSEPINREILCRDAFDVERERSVSVAHPEEDEVQVGVSTSGRCRRKPSESSVAYFETRFQELREYREIHGHTRVPKREGRLGDWVNKLRQRKDRLHEQRLERLNGIGFCWDASDDKLRKQQNQWWKQLESVRKTQSESEQESSILVIDNLVSSQKTWLRRQRIVYLESRCKPSKKLGEEQIQALNQIDRNWWKTARERKWDAQYAALNQFKRKHGHCNVTSTWKDKKLFNWVQNTRKNYRAVKFGKSNSLRSDGTPKLSPLQIELLDRIDFNWDPWGHHTDCY